MKTINAEVKLCRLRDIVYYHCKKLKGNKCTCGEIDDLEHDIIVYFKNFIETLDVLDCKAEVKFIGDNHEHLEAVQTD